MKKALLISFLTMLAGCAGTALSPECLNQGCVSDPTYGLMTRDGRALTEEGKRRQAEDEAERKRRSEEGRRRAERLVEDERMQREELKRQAEAQRTAAGARKTADEARGYVHVSFRDLFLDYKTMPLGTKRAVLGNYRKLGQLEALLDTPPIETGPRIVLLTESSPRAVRARLLQHPCGIAFCKVVVLGHTVPCAVTQPGVPVRADICFAVDELW